ncbi:Uncharacterised protein [Vibrio cholerae]|nr:Uncharacterised protein [Vibrio cholerae]CSC44313.1 Uncharacterised protein [Vibrio cholerae]CSI54331.1 Uncharacterised protein [Vibrio cholerae]
MNELFRRCFAEQLDHDWVSHKAKNRNRRYVNDEQLKHHHQRAETKSTHGISH